MADPGILSSTGAATDDFPPASPSPPPGRRIIVAHHLHLRATPDPAAPSGWSFSYDHDALVLQLCFGLPTGVDVLHVGTLRGLLDVLDLAHHDAIVAHVRHKFCCVPVLIPTRPPTPSPSCSSSPVFPLFASSESISSLASSPVRLPSPSPPTRTPPDPLPPPPVVLP